MADHRWPNLVTMFFRQADRFGERPLLWYRCDEQWLPLTWREVAVHICKLARGLKALGIHRGERVVLVSENRPAWLISDFAIMAVGGMTVPAYITSTTDDYRYLLTDSESAAVIVSTRKLAARVMAAVEDCPHVRLVIGMEDLDSPHRSDVQMLSWSQAMAQGDADHSNVRAAALQLQRTDPACIIYTSGTGGAPKGVVLPHGAILCNLEAGDAILKRLKVEDERFLSFLPPSHAYEHTVGQMLPVAIGAQIYYAESIDRIPANMLQVKPTIMAGVPRFYELLYERILQASRKQSRLSQWLLQETLRLGRRHYHEGSRMGMLLRLLDCALDQLVRRKIQARFGGGLKALVSGGAPLAPDLGISLRALGLPIFQGYGQTEAAPLISVNDPLRPRLETVGPPIPGAEVRIAEDGEILVRGELVMQGYWRNEEATQSALQDGWLHTGDIGELTADGNLKITDRKKDLIINSGGDNLSPARIEGLLTQRPEISQAIVFGDRRPHLVALLTPDPQWVKSWAGRFNKPRDVAELAEDADFLKALGDAIDEVNRSLSVLERVRRFIVSAEPFTIENGLLTPTLKVKRHAVWEVYGKALDSLYR